MQYTTIHYSDNNNEDQYSISFRDSEEMILSSSSYSHHHHDDVLFSSSSSASCPMSLKRKVIEKPLTSSRRFILLTSCLMLFTATIVLLQQFESVTSYQLRNPTSSTRTRRLASSLLFRRTRKPRPSSTSPSSIAFRPIPLLTTIDRVPFQTHHL